MCPSYLRSGNKLEVSVLDVSSKAKRKVSSKWSDLKRTASTMTFFTIRWMVLKDIRYNNEETQNYQTCWITMKNSACPDSSLRPDNKWEEYPVASRGPYGCSHIVKHTMPVLVLGVMNNISHIKLSIFLPHGLNFNTIAYIEMLDMAVMFYLKLWQSYTFFHIDLLICIYWNQGWIILSFLYSTGKK